MKSGKPGNMSSSVLLVRDSPVVSMELSSSQELELAPLLSDCPLDLLLSCCFD